jgi:hypothetical protein
MNKEDRHVYCYDCQHGDKWVRDFWKWSENKQYKKGKYARIPNICIACSPWNTEDSEPIRIRIHYKQSIKGTIRLFIENLKGKI